MNTKILPGSFRQEFVYKTHYTWISNGLTGLLSTTAKVTRSHNIIHFSNGAKITTIVIGLVARLWPGCWKEGASCPERSVYFLRNGFCKTRLLVSKSPIYCGRFVSSGDITKATGTRVMPVTSGHWARRVAAHGVKGPPCAPRIRAAAGESRRGRTQRPAAHQALSAPRARTHHLDDLGLPARLPLQGEQVLGQRHPRHQGAHAGARHSAHPRDGRPVHG